MARLETCRARNSNWRSLRHFLRKRSAHPTVMILVPFLFSKPATGFPFHVSPTTGVTWIRNFDDELTGGGGGAVEPASQEARKRRARGARLPAPWPPYFTMIKVTPLKWWVKEHFLTLITPQKQPKRQGPGPRAPPEEWQAPSGFEVLRPGRLRGRRGGPAAAAAHRAAGAGSDGKGARCLREARARFDRADWAPACWDWASCLEARFAWT